MAGVRCSAVQARPTPGLAWTSVTRDALQALAPPCAPAGHARRARVRPFAPDGPARRLGRPHDSPAQGACESGQKHDHTGTTVVLVKALRMLLCLREPWGGRGRAPRRTEAPPSPWPVGRRGLPALGVVALTLPEVASRRPPQNPRGQERTGEPPGAQQTLHHRQLRSAPGKSRGRRGRSGQDRLRLWPEGGPAVVLDICWALHTCRVRLTLWRPMIYSGYTPLYACPQVASRRKQR